MQRARRRPAVLATLLLAFLTLAACSPEVGSDAWCEQMSDTPKGDWSANEAGDYAKHCLFK
jgi:hypothetical protein